MPNNSTPTIPTVSQFANRVERRAAYAAEVSALAAWTAKKGRKGPRPETPAMTELANGVTLGSRKASAGPRASKSTISLARNGKTLAASWNKFSNVAYHMTKNMGQNPARMTTDEFAVFVANATGIPLAEVTTRSWTVTLASGDVITATAPGDAPKAVTAPKATRKARTTSNGTPRRSRASVAA